MKYIYTYIEIGESSSISNELSLVVISNYSKDTPNHLDTAMAHIIPNHPHGDGQLVTHHGQNSKMHLATAKNHKKYSPKWWPNGVILSW